MTEWESEKALEKMRSVESGVKKQGQSFKHWLMTECETIIAEIWVEWWRGDPIRAFRRNLSFHRQ